MAGRSRAPGDTTRRTLPNPHDRDPDEAFREPTPRDRWGSTRYALGRRLSAEAYRYLSYLALCFLLAGILGCGGQRPKQSLSSTPHANVRAAQRTFVIEQIVVAVNEQAETWGELIAYRDLWAQTAGPLSSSPADSNEAVAELMVRRLLVLIQAEQMSIESVSETAVSSRLESMVEAVGRDTYERVIRESGLSEAEIRTMAREEELIDRVIGRRFRYLVELAAEDERLNLGDGSQSALQRAVDDWLRLERKHRSVIISLPPDSADTTSTSEEDEPSARN